MGTIIFFFLNFPNLYFLFLFSYFFSFLSASMSGINQVVNDTERDCCDWNVKETGSIWGADDFEVLEETSYRLEKETQEMNSILSELQLELRQRKLDFKKLTDKAVKDKSALFSLISDLKRENEMLRQELGDNSLPGDYVQARQTQRF